MKQRFLNWAHRLSRYVNDPPGTVGVHRPRHFFFIITVLMDFLMIAIALGGAVLLRELALESGVTRVARADFIGEHFLPFLGYYWFGLFCCFKYADAYRGQRLIESGQETGGILWGIWFFIILTGVLGWLFRHAFAVSAFTVPLSGIAISIMVPVGRYIIAWLRTTLRENDLDIAHVLLIGTGSSAVALANRLLTMPDAGYQVMGFLDPENKTRRRWEQFRVYGGLDRLERVVKRLHIDAVFICEPDWSAKEVIEVLAKLQPLSVEVRVLSNTFRMMVERMNAPTDRIDGVPIMDFSHIRPSRWRCIVKRMIDITFSLGCLLLGAPFFALIALAIRLEGQGPIFIKQTRVGKDGRRFSFYKFRSMIPNADQLQEELAQQNERDGHVFKIRNDPRVTRVGKILRRYSLDEFPQLFNVLRGDMSLVGPRPPLEKEVVAYDAWHHHRLSGPVGLTGLWQVSGRASLTFEEMLFLDIYYLSNRSLFFDYRILVRTIRAVFGSEGAY